MPAGPTSPGQGSDQDGGVDTHSSESRHAPGPTGSGASRQTRMEVWTPTLLSPKMPPGPTGSGASHWTRMEVWTPTYLSPDMPPGPTSPGQGSDQDGGVDTHSSESRDAPWSDQSWAGVRPGWRSGYPLI